MSVSEVVIYDVTARENHVITGSIVFKIIKTDVDKVINTHYKITYIYDIINNKITYSYNNEWERKTSEIFKNDLDKYVKTHWRSSLDNNIMEE